MDREVLGDADVSDEQLAAIVGERQALREPADQDYGGRAAAVRDPEGNVWSMGTYPGE